MLAFVRDVRELRPDEADAFAGLLFASPQLGAGFIQDRSRDVFARRRPYDESLTLAVDGPDGMLGATGTAATKTVSVGGDPHLVAYVFDVATDESNRGRGLATRVLDELHAWSRSRGARLSYAHIADGNHPSVRTFERVGYARICDAVNHAFPVVDAADRVPAGRSIDDWDAASRILAQALGGFDLTRPLAGDALRAHWTSLPGWNADDVWTTGRAVLGLWDYSSVVSMVAPGAERGSPGMHYGLVLGGGGDADDLAVLLGDALARAKVRGLDIVVFFHDPLQRPVWTQPYPSMAGAYHLVARPLDHSAPILGERPVWVDPADL